MVPSVDVTPHTLEKLDEIQAIQQTKMMVEQRKKLLFQQLDLSGLDKWSEWNQVAAQALLVGYHNILSLESAELGCTNLGKHEIRVVEDKPFKERFQRIPLRLVDEIHAHMKEMLVVGAVHPSQSPWCNAVQLVCKKDRGLCFCIDFHKLNAKPRKTPICFPKYRKP